MDFSAMTSASMGQVSPGGSGLGKSQEVSALPSLITICVAPSPVLRTVSWQPTAALSWMMTS